MEVLLQEVLTDNGALQKGGDVSRWMCRLSVLSKARLEQHWTS